MTVGFDRAGVGMGVAVRCVLLDRAAGGSDSVVGGGRDAQWYRHCFELSSRRSRAHRPRIHSDERTTSVIERTYALFGVETDG